MIELTLTVAVRRPTCDRPPMTVPNSSLTHAMRVRRSPYRLVFQSAIRTTATMRIRTATPKYSTMVSILSVAEEEAERRRDKR